MRSGGMLATVICCFGRGLLTVYTNAPVAAKPAVHTNVVTAKMVAFVMTSTQSNARAREKQGKLSYGRYTSATNSGPVTPNAVPTSDGMPLTASIVIVTTVFDV